MAETELKLYAAPDDLAKLRDAVVGLAAVVRQPRTKHVVTDYYETPDLALARSGIALRVRQIGRRRIQGLKARQQSAADAGAVAGSRGEWEWPIDGETLDLRRLNRKEIAPLVPVHALGSLAALFRTEIERTIIEVKPDETTTIEVSFDEGRLLADGRSAAISEVELEVKSPERPERLGTLYRLALELLGAAPVILGAESKADRGYRLLTGESPKAVKFAASSLPADIDVLHGVRATLRDCVSYILANQAAALVETETGGVHQMRVAVRRLRSAIAMFDGFIASPESPWIVGELKWLASELGHARDWDVFATHTLTLAKETARSRAAAETVGSAAAARRRSAHAAVVRALTSPRYTALMLTLGDWLAEDRWHERLDPTCSPRLQAPLSDAGRDLLARLGRKVKKAGRKIENGRAKDRHKLRKGLKKLRYGADFLASLYPRKRVKRQLGRLSDLQDVLGALNDFAVAEALLKELSGQRRGLRNAANRLCRDLATREREEAKNLAADWRRYRKLEPFWA